MSTTNPPTSVAPSGDGRLTEAGRTAALHGLSDGPTLDVLVVGGGVTGAGIALDAASRGLRVGLVDGQDWGAGTSSRSSKLVHGGLRYLQMFDFALVAEALAERGLLMSRLAPHLVRPVSFLYPLTKWYERFYVGAGIALYDALAAVGRGARVVPTHRHLSRTGVRRLFPDIAPGSCRGAIRYYDGQVDDARLVVTLVRTAVSHGALAASRTRVEALTSDTSGRVDGAVVRDLESGREHTVHADVVVNATGVWTEQTQELADADDGLKVLTSKGIHVVVPKDRLRGESGLILQTEKSVLFVIPWSRYWVIGTTDTDYHGDLDKPLASADDIDYVLAHASTVLAEPLTRDDVVGAWAGLRPLLQPTRKRASGSAKVSREHTVAQVRPGLVSVAGGKLTTYRVMAEDAIDFALGSARTRRQPSVTDRTPLVGAARYTEVAAQAEEVGRRHGWDATRTAHLLHRYGDLMPEIAGLVDDEPALGAPLGEAPAYLRTEIVYGVTHEGALHLDEMMTSRTRLTYEQPHHALPAAAEIAELMGEQLGWDPERRQAEIAAYRDTCLAEDEAAHVSEQSVPRLAAEPVVADHAVATAAAR